MIRLQTWQLAAVGGLALGAAYFVWRRGGVQQAAQAVGVAAGQAVTGAAAGAVVGVGQAVGIPATDSSRCGAALAAGELWDASFACPAGDYIAALWQRATGTSDAPDSPENIAAWNRYALGGRTAGSGSGAYTGTDPGAP